MLAPTKIKSIGSLQELYDEYFQHFDGCIPERIVEVFRQFDYINFEYRKV